MQNPYNYMINREFINNEDEFPSVQCFKSAIDFLDLNKNADNWFKIETFDLMNHFLHPKD